MKPTAQKTLRKRSPKPTVKVAPMPKRPRTDEEARALAIKNGWGPLLKLIPSMGKA